MVLVDSLVAVRGMLNRGRFGLVWLWQGAVASVLLGLVAVFVLSFVLLTPGALAQSQVPGAATAVAVYSIASEKLEVRWSSSDAASTTLFKIQWKSGSEEFDSSRQLSSDPTTSVVAEQSTSEVERYKETITGLANGTEYTVRVVAANSNGDSDPSGEETGTPQGTFGQPRQFVENEVVEIFESSYPWLRETWDYITSQNIPVKFPGGSAGFIRVECSPSRPMESNLRKCDATEVSAGKSSPRLVHLITHELAHVYTLANSVTSTPGPLGVAYLYFDNLISPSGLGGLVCTPTELYADALTILTLGDQARDQTSYWRHCSVVTATVAEQALAVVRSATQGDMPSWFADTYNDSDGDPDLERAWADVKALPDVRRATVAFQLREAFGGYCDNRKATESAFSTGTTRNPWSDGGCVPEAPENVAATATSSGSLTVSWQEPPDDGGSPITGYKVQWKSGTQEYGSSRQAVVTGLSDLRRTITGLTNDESHTLRVSAYNHNGDGAATEVTATPTATDTTVPALLEARFDGDHVRLTWNEPLNGSSKPATTAFTVNVNGSSRGISNVSVTGSVVTLSLTGVVSATDTLTVGYSAPTGSTAMPLKDSAGNNAADLAAQSVRNDVTGVAFTSSPGSDMTYAWRNGFGGQDVIEATVTFSESVVVSGVPELELLVGGRKRRATYRSGSGSTSLVFRYEVTEDETDSDGVSVPSGAISTAGGLVRYASTKATAPAEVMLGPQAGHLVDAVRPVVVSAEALADGNDIVVTWDKDLDEGSVPLAIGNGFYVLDGNGDRVRISAVSVLGRVVTLTLQSTIPATDRRRVVYDWPFSHYDVTEAALLDTVGNYAGHNSVQASIRIPNRLPEFPATEDGTRSVDENTLAGRNVGAAIAADDADNDTLTYSIEGVDAAFFDVVAASGQLRTKAALDHESRDTYSFTMSVHDGKDIRGNPDTTADDTISVTVTVDDVNEPPDVSFAASSGVTASDSALTVEENHSGSLAVFSASDPENKAGLTYMWSLGGSDQGDFSITEAGVLSFAAVPDYERPADSGRDNVYDLTVSARDSDTMAATVTVTVTVDPVNEPPVITGDAAVSIEEEGTLLIGTYRASDPEGTLIAWQPLGGDDRDKFEFTASNGRLAFRAAPDFEDAADSGRDRVYNVTVAVSSGGHTTTLDVAVGVTNKDEGGALRFSSPRPQADADYTATLSDPDGVLSTTWTWERSTSRNGPWTRITGSSDGITTSVYGPAAGDVGYYLRASAVYTDGHGPNKSRLLVSANPVRPDPGANVAPSFSDRTPTRSIAENARAGAAVGATVTAIDTDNGDVVTYELSGSDLFTIDSSSGQIRVVASDSLDHETTPAHNVTVKAGDTSNESDTVTVTIEVNDVNEPPDAVADTGRATEDGDVAIDVLANDSDPEDDRSELTLRVVTNPRRGSATLNEPDNAGESPTITYTPNANYYGADFFTYEVSDSGSPSLTARATVSVEVEAVNDPPTFPSPTTTREVFESADSGDRVGAPLIATDVDDNDTLTYGLSGTDARFFEIEPRRGQITVGDGVTFDIETKDTYAVSVYTEDGNGGRATVEVIITVTTSTSTSTSTRGGGGGGGGSGGGGGGGGGGSGLVQDTGAPGFVEGSAAVRSVGENSLPGVKIGSPVTASDPDGDPLTYTLRGTDADLFDIDTSTGQLLTKAALDHETNNSHTVTVEVRDSKDAEGEPDQRRDDTIGVTILVTNQDDPGVLTPSAPTPRVGEPFSAALTDPDGGVAGVTWEWDRSPDQTTWTRIDDATTNTYTPTADDQGHHLRVTATYTDTFGANKTATRTTDAATTTGVVTDFEDVAAGGVHTPAIEALAPDGVFADTECAGEGFCPRDPIRRWVIAVWLIRALDGDPATVGASRFGDIGQGQWWIRYAEQLADRQITRGCVIDPPQYCPDQSVTRAQMASFLVRAFNLPPAQTPAGFADTQANIHEANIDALYAAGITIGCDTDPLRYCPRQPVTRAQMATLLNRALKHQPPPANPGQFIHTNTHGGGPGAEHHRDFREFFWESRFLRHRTPYMTP